jgi:hypothetical protein
MHLAYDERATEDFQIWMALAYDPRAMSSLLRRCIGQPETR